MGLPRGKTRAEQRAYENEYRRLNQDKTRRQAREYARRHLAAAQAFLGGKCVHCGFSDPRALQIDHIEGGGRVEARKMGRYGMIKRVLSGAPGYQLLCANCNVIKRYENGEGYIRG